MTALPGDRDVQIERLKVALHATGDGKDCVGARCDPDGDDMTAWHTDRAAALYDAGLRVEAESALPRRDASEGGDDLGAALDAERIQALWVEWKGDTASDHLTSEQYDAAFSFRVKLARALEGKP